MGAKRHPVARKAGGAACVDRCTKTMMLQISFFAIVFSKIFHRRRSGSFARVVRSLAFDAAKNLFLLKKIFDRSIDFYHQFYREIAISMPSSGYRTRQFA